MNRRLPYASVNDAINDVFFDGRFAAQPVYLSMDSAMREEVAARLSIDPSAVDAVICETVKATLPNSADPYSRHASTAGLWQREGMRTPPPFSAVLYSLAFAAELMEEEGQFASSNYYIRLAQITGLDREYLKRGMRNTEPLWIALNDWLIANNHVLGRPTAFTNGSTWRYVDWPVSQAIVRASDRDRFHDLFERFGFTGNENISRREMGHYLASWMLSSRPNAHLRNAWRKKELRDRVAEAAVAELAVWSSAGGTDAATSQRRGAKLSLLASIVPRLTGPSLELHLGYLGEQDEPAVLESDGQAFQLANDNFGSFATISPSPFQAGNRALGQSHAFALQGSPRTLGWEPRLVIPLAQPSRASLWVEAVRVSFGVPHLVLVRDTNNLPRKVEAYLIGAMNTKPTIATPADLKGLPAGWVMYDGVVIQNVVDTQVSNDLDCLTPLDDGGVLSLSKGLQLLPSFYHSRSTPVASLSVPRGPARLDALPLGSSDILLSSTNSTREASLALDASKFGQDAIQLRGYDAGQLVEMEEVYFRDANTPTPLHRSGRGQLSYVSLLSATVHEIEPPLSVAGMQVGGELPALPKAAATTARRSILPGGHDEVAQEAAYSQGIEQQARRQACIENGYHVWKFPMVPADTPRGTPFEGRCTSCDQPLIIVYRPRHKAQPTPALPARQRLESIRTPIKMATTLDHDLLVDALSFLGTGTWSKFETLLESISPDQQYVRQVAQQYSSLGILDLEVRPGPGAIRSWSVPMACINFVERDRAFLSGFRNTDLVERLAGIVASAGGRLLKQPMPGAPTAIFIEGLDAAELRNVVDGTTDPHRRVVEVNEDPARKLAAACLGMPALEASLAPISIGRVRNLQRFDLEAAEWKDIERVKGAGCYRWNEGYQAYAFVGKDNTAKAGPYQAVKLLASRAEGIRLHAYETREGVFRSTLGSEPPGLLSRALVACSGRLPSRQANTIAFANVPPEVGEAILSILYPGDSDA